MTLDTYKIDFANDNDRFLANLNNDLIEIHKKIETVSPLNKFSDTEIWSNNFIDADKVYRIHKFAQKVVEESGVLIHKLLIKKLLLENKIYPYNIQLIQIDKSIINTDIVVENQICQTITPLNRYLKTYIIDNNNGDIEIPEIEIGEYAVAAYWTEYRDPKYKNWFLGKHMEIYG